MNLITYFPKAAGSGACPKATAPVVHQADETVAVGNGSAPITLLEVAAASVAAFGGQIANKGCNDILATFNYLDGDDCDECTTPDTLTVVPVTVKIAAGTSFPLPEGFHSGGAFVTVDSAGLAVDVQVAQEVSYYSAYQPCCNSNVLVP